MRLSNERIGEIADGIYRRYFGSEVVESVSGDEFIDSTGDEAIRVNIMIKPGTADRLKGEALGDAALDLQDALTAAGEGRFAHPSFGEVGEIFEADEEEIEEAEFEKDDARSQS